MIKNKLFSYSLLALVAVSLVAGCTDVSTEPVPVVSAPTSPTEPVPVEPSPEPSTETPDTSLPEPEDEFAELYCGIVENDGAVTEADAEFADAYADKVESGEIPGGEFFANDLRFFADQIRASIENNNGQLFPSRFQDAVNACNSVS